MHRQVTLGQNNCSQIQNRSSVNSIIISSQLTTSSDEWVIQIQFQQSIFFQCTPRKNTNDNDNDSNNNH